MVLTKSPMFRKHDGMVFRGLCTTSPTVSDDHAEHETCPGDSASASSKSSSPMQQPPLFAAESLHPHPLFVWPSMLCPCSIWTAFVDCVTFVVSSFFLAEPTFLPSSIPAPFLCPSTFGLRLALPCLPFPSPPPSLKMSTSSCSQIVCPETQQGEQ